MEGNETGVTRRQAGIGMALLGLIILLLTGVFFILSVMQSDSFHLFSGEAHLIFDLMLGIAFLAIGLALMKSGAAKQNGNLGEAPRT